MAMQVSDLHGIFHWIASSITIRQRQVGQKWAKGIPVSRDAKELSEPPRMDVCVIVSSGRFTPDAVAAIEKHNQSDTGLEVEMWPESHLERVLATRPDLIGAFGPYPAGKQRHDTASRSAISFRSPMRPSNIASTASLHPAAWAAGSIPKAFRSLASDSAKPSPVR